MLVLRCVIYRRFSSAQGHDLLAQLDAKLLLPLQLALQFLDRLQGVEVNGPLLFFQRPLYPSAVVRFTVLDLRLFIIHFREVFNSLTEVRKRFGRLFGLEFIGSN